MDIFDAIPAPVVALCQRLREHDRRGWVVGGCVRDLLRGAEAKDWDIATDARPEEVQRIFKRVIPTGIQHGTVTVLMSGEAYEVTTLRGEGAYADGRRPEEVVFLDDITQDLARRDFTFNAIAIEPLERQLVDPFGGEGDLRAGILRAVGDARQRFCEDGLRILRGARFAATLECDIDAATRLAMGDADSLATLRKVSAERIHDEWMKSMRAARPSIAFSIMESSGVIDVCCPELRPTVECQRSDGTSVWSHCLGVVDALVEPALRIAGLLHDVAQPVDASRHAELGAEMVGGIMRRLKFSNDNRSLAVDIVKHHAVSYSADWTDAQVRHWLRLVTRQRIESQLTFALANASANDDGGQRLRLVEELVMRCRRLEHDAVLTPGDLCLRGADFIRELALAPGPRVGELLRELVDIALDDPAANDSAALMKHAKRLLEERP